MKKWLIEGFLPMWAKETVLSENRNLTRQNQQLIQENQKLKAYIQGMEQGIRSGKRITVYNGGNR